MGHGKGVKRAKMAHDSGEKVAEMPVEPGHKHRCNDCGVWYYHNDPKCNRINLSWRVCDTCQAVASTFGFTCESCTSGIVKMRCLVNYQTKVSGIPVVVPMARIGICDRCGAEHFNPTEVERWGQGLPPSLIPANVQSELSKIPIVQAAFKEAFDGEATSKETLPN